MNVFRAATAGIIGGVIVDAFLVAVHVAPFPGIYEFIASTLVGPVAYTSSGYIALGLAMHFTISIVFALVYAFVAERSSVLIEKPIASGAVFGVAVLVVMQVVTRIVHAAQPPSASGIAMGLVAHVVFFGIPVAWYIASGGNRRAVAA